MNLAFPSPTSVLSALLYRLHKSMQSDSPAEGLMEEFVFCNLFLLCSHFFLRFFFFFGFLHKKNRRESIGFVFLPHTKWDLGVCVCLVVMTISLVFIGLQVNTTYEIQFSL